LKLFRKKWAPIALILTMMLSLFWPLSVSAASVINITNLVTHAAQNAPLPPLDSVTDSAVQRFTQNPIDITADISGFSADQISSIYYEIVNINTGVVASNTVNKPTQSSTNSNSITFNNVQLSEGLNKITIKYGASSAVASLPGWAYFTPVSNISNLQFNGVSFTNNGTFPQQAPYSNSIITGSAPNATEVDATVGGTTYTASAFTNGTFTFITNSGRSSDITFNAGDNLVTFIAKNLTNSYTIDKPFVYDNGKAFAYNAQIQAKPASTPAVARNLYSVPTVIKNGTDNVTVSASIKNPVTSGSPDYTSLDVTVLGIPSSSFKIHYDFTNPSALPVITGGLNPNSAPLTNTSISSTSANNIFNFTSDLPVNTGSSFQQVLFTFTNAGLVTTQTAYTYYFFDPNTAYTDHVAQKFNSTSVGTSYEVNLNPNGSTQINQFPSTLNIYTNSNTSKINVKVGGVDYSDSTSSDYIANSPGMYQVRAALDSSSPPQPIKDAQGNALKVTTVNLQGIQDGPNILTITPYDSSPTPAPSPAGIKQYSVNIASSPYVIVTNLFNGKVISNPMQLSCLGQATGTGPCISGRLVNLPYSEYGNIKLSINDNPIQINPSNIQAQNAAATATDFIFNDGTFVLPRSAFNIPGSTSNPTATYFDSDGKKTIKFNLYVSGQLVTSTSIDIYMLSDASPLISDFVPTVSPNAPNAKFTAGNKPDSYITDSNEFQLKGTIANVDISAPSTQWSLTATAPGGTPNALSLSMIGSKQQDPNDVKKFTENFQLTSPYVMPNGVYGDFIFQLTATNASGITVNKTLTITRNPVAYLIIQPALLIKNANNQDQANINSNYQNIIIQADNADSVIIGKTPATLIGGTTNQYQLEIPNLKAGLNTVSITVNRGTAKSAGTLVLNNQNTSMEGAQFKTALAPKMSAFNGKLQLNFPTGTKLMRNDFTQSVDNQFITSGRKILFGIASLLDGRVDKTVESSATPGPALLIEQSGRFRSASQRYWIDAGTIPVTSLNAPNQLQASLTGSGVLPNSAGQEFYNRGYTDLVVPTQSGQLTLSYDSSILADAAKYITVYQYKTFLNPGDPTIINNTAYQQRGWVNLGGVVNSKNNTITVPITSFGYFQVMYMDNSFTDVTNHAWARDDLDTLYTKGYMQNKVTGLFMPDDPISRGEFVTMLVNAIGIPLINTDTSTNITSPTDPNYSGSFGDVRRGVANPLYDFMHIEAAARAGLIRGAAQGVFLPNNLISRQDAAVVIARAMKLKLAANEQISLTNLQKLFTDAGSIDVYALQSVEAVAKAGIVEGIQNALLPNQKKPTFSFDPTGTFTRAQAGEVVIRILRSLKKI
jgi:hypothetical protein